MARLVGTSTYRRNNNWNMFMIFLTKCQTLLSWSGPVSLWILSYCKSFVDCSLQQYNYIAPCPSVAPICHQTRCNGKRVMQCKHGTGKSAWNHNKICSTRSIFVQNGGNKCWVSIKCSDKHVLGKSCSHLVLRSKPTLECKNKDILTCLHISQMPLHPCYWNLRAFLRSLKTFKNLFSVQRTNEKQNF